MRALTSGLAILAIAAGCVSNPPLSEGRARLVEDTIDRVSKVRFSLAVANACDAKLARKLPYLTAKIALEEGEEGKTSGSASIFGIGAGAELASKATNSWSFDILGSGLPEVSCVVGNTRVCSRTRKKCEDSFAAEINNSRRLYLGSRATFHKANEPFCMRYKATVATVGEFSGELGASLLAIDAGVSVSDALSTKAIVDLKMGTERRTCNV